MRLLAIVGILSVLAVFALGIGFLVNGNSGGWSLVIVGAVMTVFWIVMVPAARRRGKL